MIKVTALKCFSFPARDIQSFTIEAGIFCRNIKT